MNICGNYLRFRSPHQKQCTNFCGKSYEPSTLDSTASRNIPKSKKSDVSVVFFVLLGQLLISNWISLGPSSQLRVLFAQAWCQHSISLSTEKKYQNAPNTFKKMLKITQKNYILIVNGQRNYMFLKINIRENNTYMTSKNVEEKIESNSNPHSSCDELVPSPWEFLRRQVNSKNPWHILGKKKKVQKLPLIQILRPLLFWNET